MKRLEQWEEVQKQQKIALTTVTQLSSMVKEMDNVRNQVVDSEVDKFDKLIKNSKLNALTAVRSYRPTGKNMPFKLIQLRFKLNKLIETCLLSLLDNTALVIKIRLSTLRNYITLN